MAQGTDSRKTKSGKAQAKPRGKVSYDRTAKKPPMEKPSQHTPIGLQQTILNVFRGSFPDQSGDLLQQLVQELKGHLFNRNFNKAFDRPDLQAAYAIRWSPSRALAYLEMLCDLPILSNSMKKASSTLNNGKIAEKNGEESSKLTVSSGELEAIQLLEGSHTSSESIDSKKLNIVCIGGGSGSELLAFAGYLKVLSLETGQSSIDNIEATTDLENDLQLAFDIKIIDIADWSDVVAKLYTGATNCPPLSKYSSTSTASRNPLVEPNSFSVSFTQQDVLQAEVELLASVLQNVTLVTMLFTLNELYSVSMSKTTNFLLALSYLMEAGSLLLVVDSPGSYSTINMDNRSKQPDSTSEKKYPMGWLLDHVLLKSSNIENSINTTKKGQWEKLISNDSKWFRLPPTLKYSVELEDMRYQLHLYRHC
ncbi:MAG: hypothetical protein MMC33_001592 [Icmadophila ericetorum]|nr:hypothetical protein [Icmadophila ericetorum]